MAVGGVARDQHGLMLTEKTSKKTLALCARIDRIKNAKLGHRLQMHNSVTE